MMQTVMMGCVDDDNDDDDNDDDHDDGNNDTDDDNDNDKSPPANELSPAENNSINSLPTLRS